MRPASKSPDKTFYIYFFNLCISEWTTNKHNTKCNSFTLKSSLDTPLREQITSFYNHEDNNKFLISTNANDAILQRFLINNFVVVYPSAYVLQELYNEEFDCKLEVGVVHASHAEHVRALNYLIHPMSIVKGLKHCQRFVALVGQRLLHLLFTVPSSEVSDSDNNVRSETIIYCIKETRTHRFVFLMLFKICQHFETEKKIKNKSSCN